MGHFDPDSLQEQDGPDAAAPARGDEKTGTRPPGSLMSLKIRKRTPSATVGAPPPPGDRAGPDTTREERPKDKAAKPKPDERPRPEKTEAASDPISRIARRVQSACAARAAPRPRTPRPNPAARAAVEPPPTPAMPHLEEAASPAPEGGHQDVRTKRDIVAYWTRLRGGRRYPRSGDLDAATLGDHWPNSILMRCRPGSRALEPDKVFMTGESTASSLTGLRSSGRVNLSPMMLQWLLGLAGEVVREGRPMNDVETFPSVNRVVHYRAVALPFSDNEREVDHVLCHVGPEV